MHNNRLFGMALSEKNVSYILSLVVLAIKIYMAIH